ncbi:MAG: hybrid sensor histidine kinase/response regulator [Nitrospirae bacterium]|nr:MAG: hybrid sensor histidine kinase/response regulator [Nitrospirota bacterium]
MSDLLVVDDDELNREIYRRHLEGAGHRVVTAASGEEALAYVERAVPDLILLDVHMPGMDGFTVCRRIRERPGGEDIPILFITAKYHDDVSIAQGLALGASDYLAKPFNGAELVARVASVASQGHERIALRRRSAGLEEEVEAKEHALAESERRFREVVEHAADAICVIDRRGRFTVVNRQACRILGRDREALLRSRAVDFLPHEEYVRLRSHLLAALRRRGTVEARCRVRGAGGEAIPVELSASVLEGELLVLGRDIRERLALEEGLRRADRLQAIGQLASGLVHEIRNPLTGIVATLTHWRNQGDLAPERQEAVSRMLEETRRVERLLADLLDYARPREVRYQRVLLAHLLGQAASLVSAKAEEQGVAVELSVEPEALIVEVDPHQLEQVLLNLCLNALQAMDGPGTLRLAGRLRPGGVRIEVADTGPGIAPEIQHRIFQPFYTTRHAEGGTGLGLALVQRIVHDHGGEVAVESAPGRGTTFVLTLPENRNHPERQP